ncbi:hypothetical protein PC112_g6695 [Phytophthora cactorum]|nr:hypothetical protein PC112_g6695 [Phytophthora cactorum]
MEEEEEEEETAVFNFSVLGMTENQTFEGIFKERCKAKWLFAKAASDLVMLFSS